MKGSVGVHKSDGIEKDPQYKPLISVILPVCNGAETVERAIYSLGSLRAVQAELVIVDDGSTDGTVTVLQDIAKKLKTESIRILRQEHAGVVEASNHAIQQSKGEWIARIDADDWSSPHRLKSQIDFALKENVDIVSCLVKIVSLDGHPALSLAEYERWLNEVISTEEILAERFVELPIPNPSILAKREVFELQYRHGNYPEDYDLWLRAMAVGYRPKKVPRTLYWWTDHPDRVTRNQSIYTKAAFINAKKLHLPDGPLAGVSTCDFWGAGIEGKPWIRWLIENGINIRNIIEVNPRKLGQKIHGIPVIPPENIITSPHFPLFVGVGVPEGRRKIKEFIHGHLPHTPGEDAWFLC